MSLRLMPVPDGLTGERVDAALARMTGLSRTKVGEICAEGGVRLDGAALSKSDRLGAGAVLEVDMPEPRPVEPVATPVEGMGILYEDEDIVVVDKPAGVAAHPSMGWDGPDILGALKAMRVRVATSGAAERQGIVSRLDVGTSGVMIVAKGETAYSVLKRAFREHTVEKVYHALVQGHLDPTSGTIDAPIGRHPSREWKMAVIDGGRESVTHYDVIESMPTADLVEVHLETGRTHQIRVHMSAVGHPCVGDATYGASPALTERTGLVRQWLHAHELGLAHPVTGEWMTFRSAYPEDLVHALDVLRDASVLR
ncbi:MULTISPECIES: RluA family pseudouridine synthase [unclassified Actinomyces]|uniref:RluA family pseudouridine synthase n=1 Tax=unclassified Actinomyces TaxID=2609248 RepID=UPI002017A755|nr:MULTISPECIES: RluA family pseudouridine synthase [unclassified Actinomyces]MCL3778239.1 RluA family pseudouridine synthase [Actinomyces sp. AC-20-1]MCL3789142.1 RluA family pseudouridine synthase [Actinomyces sp. 187325]MCL3791497.1 RluA family pseudouridine synthase [Actinomyces sp. 186855]MCL3794087.1 RluA family pseudouridine synthase [Actinomyces sp. 217892]